MKAPLLLLCHRIPYPPNKGDKIRAFHLLKYLVEHYSVYLGCFIDDPQDWTHIEPLKALCEECLFINLNPMRAKVRSTKGFLKNQALSIPYYESVQLTQWVKDLNQQKGVSKAVAFSSPMAQFLNGPSIEFDKTVLDLVDIDSDKWAQYAEKKSWPMSWIYQREARHLFEYEKWIAQHFDASLFVSSTEAELFKQMVPEHKNKIGFYNNGVNADYFCPRNDYAQVYPETQNVVVFTGAMDYWPNIDAVTWFVEQVLPMLSAQDASIAFYIVGSNPSASVKQLASSYQNVFVTGRVEDIRPYIAHASVAVAPMRIARGIQNKVLEAMAMQVPVVVTDMGLEGISAIPEEEVFVANTATEISAAIVQLIQSDKAVQVGQAARARVISDFSWHSSLPIVRQLLESDSMEL